ncbi:MAG: glucose-6-phosphate dehydrogenase [Kordiimonadaceae bacterium]|jgi:glucose-6-phosphate 1-dehydrogenase|nr:glucose-6-phosphate dehydrogenase [Kordiimonadaceae bacterium]MBT6032093.1 glucose-6-phosphate dehydrogenase [Kordiimonadaceae bacterium]
MTLDIIIFGGVGDLSLRKLLPSLYYLYKDGNLEQESRILCVSRKKNSRQEFLDIVGDKLQKYVSQDYDAEAWKGFSSILSYIDIDVSSSDDWYKLGGFLNISSSDNDKKIVYYLSVMPSLFAPVCRQLAANNLNPSYSRVVVEKPLGEDFATALEVNEVLRVSFQEKQIYRIDHYLGKEAVQNIMYLRFGNYMMDALWNKKHIESVNITVAETVGVERRIAFLDHVGTLRDMVQNHLMQLLTLVAMDAPESLDADNVRDEKCKVIKELRPITAKNSRENTIRAQYTSGSIHGSDVLSYQEELSRSDVDCDGDGETFVFIKANIDNERWEGVPFNLKTGKRLAGRFAEIRIKFKASEVNLFNSDKKNEIIINIQPDLTVSFDMIMKKMLGDTTQYSAHQYNMDLSQGAYRVVRVPKDYEKLIFEVIKGNQTYFVRDDEILASWKWIDGIRKAWAETDQEVREYQAGSMGPQLD